MADLDFFYPFDAGAGATVNEAQWREMARRFMGTGVLDEGQGLEVYAPQSGMVVNVRSGVCWVEGHLGKADTEKAVAIQAADLSLPRIDLIVVRCDFVSNVISFESIVGEPFTNPQAPEVTIDETRGELALAEVTVPAQATSITTANVDDVRAYTGASEPLVIGPHDHAGIYSPVAHHHDTTYQKLPTSGYSFVETPGGVRRIFTGSTSPSGAQAGDIWLRPTV